MWIAKIKFSVKETLIGSKAEKYGVSLFAFPLSYTYEKNWIIVHITGTVLGKEKNKKELLKELKKEKRVINFEINNDFFIGTIKEPLFFKTIYNKDIISIAPAIISDKGYDIFIVGSFKREALIKLAETLEKERNGELLSIENKKMSSISITKLRPELTEKQRRAIELAIQHGYYKSPRKIDVQKLAKISGLSYSTFQVHLRKAEEKLIPYYVGK
ncbi:MAG: helix-turn-helix domain-containing protein [Nanoarchaeota archaeon]|nr:helix-turn-helix domain-containing protein [Nanoarchaeota archaeon]